jgi:hypothetical protein
VVFVEMWRLRDQDTDSVILNSEISSKRRVPRPGKNVKIFYNERSTLTPFNKFFRGLPISSDTPNKFATGLPTISETFKGEWPYYHKKEQPFLQWAP